MVACPCERRLNGVCVGLVPHRGIMFCLDISIGSRGAFLKLSKLHDGQDHRKGLFLPDEVALTREGLVCWRGTQGNFKVMSVIFKLKGDTQMQTELRKEVDDLISSI